MSEQSPNPKPNPWKIAVLAIGAVALAVVAGTAMGFLDESRSEASERPSATIVEDCNRYAAGATRDAGKVLKDGVLGGAVGAGVGAAGGAIADGGDGAGKGAGIGAIVGATAGTLYGLTEENRRTEAARHAYRECMQRNGYSG